MLCIVKWSKSREDHALSRCSFMQRLHMSPPCLSAIRGRGFEAPNENSYFNYVVVFFLLVMKVTLSHKEFCGIIFI